MRSSTLSLFVQLSSKYRRSVTLLPVFAARHIIQLLQPYTCSLNRNDCSKIDQTCNSYGRITCSEQCPTGPGQINRFVCP
ncbi:hypothetical protein AAHC03_09080 [Spirometra sp. Aus1]